MAFLRAGHGRRGLRPQHFGGGAQEGQEFKVLFVFKVFEASLGSFKNKKQEGFTLGRHASSLVAFISLFALLNFMTRNCCPW